MLRLVVPIPREPFVVHRAFFSINQQVGLKEKAILRPVRILRLVPSIIVDRGVR